MNNLSVNIGEIVVQGAAERLSGSERLGTLIETSLQQLARQHGLSTEVLTRKTRMINNLSINLPLHAEAEDIARELAAAIYQSLNETR